MTRRFTRSCSMTEPSMVIAPTSLDAPLSALKVMTWIASGARGLEVVTGFAGVLGDPGHVS